LKTITGNITPTEGVIEVHGRIQALLELGTGFHPEFTGRQNIRASLAYQGLSAARRRTKEEEIIEFAELEEFIEQPVRTYSAGMYARLAFATATAIEPDILIVDEVLGAGDAYFAGKCVEQMRKLTEGAGATVLFVSHDLGSVQRLCTRALWIDRGRIVQQGDPLDVIKAYTALVRQEEELRLKARDLKVLKKQAAQLGRQDEVYDSLLFHLVGAHRVPGEQRARIFRLRLCLGQEEIGAIEVGSPMDNSPEHRHYLIDTPRYMDWGPPRQDSHGVYREYGDFRARYAHAPFEFAVPKACWQTPGTEICLEVDAQVFAETVAVEVYDQHQYVRLGCLPPGPRQVTVWRFLRPVVQPESRPPASTPTSAPLAMARPTDSEYGSGEAKITAVHMRDHLGRDSRIFELGQPWQVTLDFEADQVLRQPVFVFCVYLADGQCFSQWLVSSEQLGRSCIYGKGCVTFTIDHPAMGKASYVASAAIFKYVRPDGQEAESYHVLDRCIHFQIVSQPGEAVERGLCLQPFRADLHLYE
jgi:lipopolysaccharide transport system ATP-binding protein